MNYLKILCIFYLPVIFGDLQTKKTTDFLLKTIKNEVKYDFPVFKKFSNYTIINPIYDYKQSTRVSRSINNDTGQQVALLTFHFQLDGEVIYVDLKRNDDFLPTKQHVHLQGKNHKNASSEYVLQNLTKQATEFCYYQGTVRNKSQSKVILSTCNDSINGIIYLADETYFIQTSLGKNFLFREKHLINNASKSKFQAIDTTETKTELKSRPKRAPEIYDDYPKMPYNANEQSSFVELVLVVDNRIYNKFGKNVEKIYQHCKDLTNIINAIYEQINIFVILVDVVIWNEYDEIDITIDPGRTLDNFLAYRKTKLLPQIPHDHAQLLTLMEFEKGIVGRAYLSGICSENYSGAVCVDHSDVIGLVAATMAHEMGHNFGLPHDESIENCVCPVRKCVMAETISSTVAVYWSRCSLEIMNDALARHMNYCMQNKPKRNFGTTSTCGNGLVEPGEQCDCGLPDFCHNLCCNPLTCQLRANATCAAGTCCNIETCSLKEAGSICRTSSNECDLPEYCNGETEFCPSDAFKNDLETCDDNFAFCYNGKCQSHRLQCQFLWGQTGESVPECYSNNMRGTRQGNCGLDRITGAYKACSSEHQFCGMLQCQHLAEEPIISSASMRRTVTDYTFRNRRPVTCYGVSVDFGLDYNDPGLVPDGAKCGENKMCLNQACISLDTLRVANGLGKKCPNDCSGNGVCNNHGHCHCNIGFGGEACNFPGAGGSIDSGPATNPKFESTFRRFMLIFFCGAVPCVILAFLLFTYCFRHFQLKQKLNVFKKLVKRKKEIERPNFLSVPSSEDSANVFENVELPKSSSSCSSNIDLKTDYTIKVIDLTRKGEASTLKTMPRTLNLSNYSLRRLNEKSNKSVENKETMPTKMASCNQLNVENDKRIKFKISDVQLQSTTNESVKSLLKRHSKSCENL